MKSGFILSFFLIMLSACNKDPYIKKSPAPPGCIDQNWISHFWLDQFQANSGDTFVMVYHDTVSGKYDTSILYDFRYAVDSTNYIPETPYYMNFSYEYESTTQNTWGGLTVHTLRIDGRVGKDDCIHSIHGYYSFGGVFSALYDPSTEEWEVDSIIAVDSIQAGGSTYNDVYYFPCSSSYEELYFVRIKGSSKRQLAMKVLLT